MTKVKVDQEANTDPIWDVRLEILKDFMYCHKSQLITEVIQAPDKDSAQDKALKANDMTIEQVNNETVKVLGIRLYSDE